MDAYDEMYRQHVDDATRVARTVANSGDEATDVVFEAFARLLVRLRERGEPDAGIEEYLRTVVRRLALGRHPNVTQSEVNAPNADDPVAESDGFARIRQAYEALPDEWQQMLWHAEVERKSQLALARGLDISTSRVAALILRAREGLRQAYAAIALADNVRDECRDWAPNIAIHVKGMLPSKIARDFNKHLGNCTSCRQFRDDFVLLISDLRRTLFAALLRPGAPDTAASADTEPTRQPAIAAPKVPVATAPVGLTELSMTAEPDDEFDDVEGPPTIPALVTPLAPAIEREDAYPARRRPVRAIVAGFGAVAALTVVAGFALAGALSPDDPSSTALNDVSDVEPGLPGAVGDPDRASGVGAIAEVVKAEEDEDKTTIDDEGTDVVVEQEPSDQPTVETTPTETMTPNDQPSSNGPSPLGDPVIKPAFTSHPKDASATPGQTVTFAVGVSGSPKPDVQWQKRISSGASWANVSGATAHSLAVKVTEASDGHQYRAVASNSAGKTNSGVATVTVNVPPKITENPRDTTTAVGGEAHFTAAAIADPGMTAVKWQRSTGGGWEDMNVDVPSGTYTSLTLKDVQASWNGYEYRAVFSNEYGDTATSEATLTVTDP